MRIYLDNCCFNRPFDDQTQKKIQLESEAKLFVQNEILEGRYELVWSYILDYENAVNPFEERKNTIALWRGIAVSDCNENNDIVSMAEDIVNQGIKAKDALHLACAIHAKCEYFITTDIGLLKKSSGLIKIVSPIEFVRRMEDGEL